MASVFVPLEFYGAGFGSAHSVEEARRQHSRLPTDDIWWTVNGKDMAWNFKNLHQIFPTVNVYRSGPVKNLRSDINENIARHPVQTPVGAIPFARFIESEHSTAMGVVILHQGRIAFESYPRMQAHEKPIYWSVAKVLVGTMVRILEERGQINVSEPIERYLPELTGSVLAGTAVRHILDMASGLDCGDDYENIDSCYYRYSVSIGDGFTKTNKRQDPYQFVSTLKAERQNAPGKQFSYSGLNTFVLTWLVERITDMPFHDALTKEIWWHLGAESDASFIAPTQGIPITHGGFLSRMRDLARFGLLFTPSSGLLTNKSIITPSHNDFLFTQGDPELLKNSGLGYLLENGVKHNIYQWDAVHDNGTLFKGGWAGQGLIVNPQWDLVAVFTSYHKDDKHSEIPLTPVIFEMLNSLYGS